MVKVSVKSLQVFTLLLIFSWRGVIENKKFFMDI